MRNCRWATSAVVLLSASGLLVAQAPSGSAAQPSPRVDVQVSLLASRTPTATEVSTPTPTTTTPTTTTPTDPIGAYYSKLGGQSSYLGSPLGPVYPIPGGEAEDFVGGSIYWSSRTGAHAVQGAILVHYRSLGGPGGFLGYPVTDETATADKVGRFNHFANDGSIYWTKATGAWSIHGAIRDHWVAMGSERSPLGYPVTDESGTPDGIGRFNHFNGSGGASIYWTPQTGAWSIRGGIRAHWAAMGWETSALGYPVTDEMGTSDGIGRYNHFSNDGSIYWTPATRAWSVHGAIQDRWASMGWERSSLGYPTSDEYAIPAGRQNNFVSGIIVWDAVSGATTVNVGCPINNTNLYGADPNVMANTGGGSQLVTVSDPSSSSVAGTLTAWTKQPSGCWVPMSFGGQPPLPYSAETGYGGIVPFANRVENDGTTPQGVFGFGSTMYGVSNISPNPSYGYRPLVCGDWWDEKPGSPTYDSFQVYPCGVTPPFADSAEALWTETVAYVHFADILTPNPPQNSGGIFLHDDTTSGDTAGCVALPPGELDAVLGWLNPGAHPHIIIGTAAAMNSL